jgi:hypothetical protein
MNGFSENSGLDNSFYPEFFNEGLYLVRERVKAPQSAEVDSVRQNLSGAIEKESSVSPFNGLKRPETLLLFNYQEGQDIPEADRQFVTKVLEAANQQFAEAEKLNINAAGIAAWEDIVKHSDAACILAFGIPAQLLPEGLERGKLLMSEDRKILSMESLGIVAANISLKKLLWEGLKQMYQV